MTFQLLIWGTVLILANVLLILIIRQNYSFSQFPSVFLILLGVGTAGYMLFFNLNMEELKPVSRSSLTKATPKTNNKAKGSTTFWFGKFTPENQEEKVVRLKIEKANGENRLMSAATDMHLLLNLLILQCIIGFTSAFIGRRVVVNKKEHYHKYIILNLVLVVVFVLIKGIFLIKF